MVRRNGTNNIVMGSGWIQSNNEDECRYFDVRLPADPIVKMGDHAKWKVLIAFAGIGHPLRPGSGNVTFRVEIARPLYLPSVESSNAAWTLSVQSVIVRPLAALFESVATLMEMSKAPAARLELAVMCAVTAVRCRAGP